MLGELESFITACNQVETPDALHEEMVKTLKAIGVERYTYIGLHVPKMSEQPIFMTTYPMDWAARYEEQEYIYEDPVMHQARIGILPFSWPEIYDATRASTTQRQIFNEAQEFGLKNGITVPVHGPGGEFAMASFATDFGDNTFNDLHREKGITLQQISLHFHDVLRSKFDPKPDPQATLSKREIEVLHWAAQDKTYADIADILHRSERTVIFHMENAKRKLGCYSKLQAVVRAIMLGLIRP